MPANTPRAIPMLLLERAGEAMDLYKKAFGASENSRTNCPVTGRLVHGSLSIGETELFFGEYRPEDQAKMSSEMKCEPSKGQSIYVYVPDADAAMKQALAAGLKEAMPVQDMFWGDRTGMAVDPFGLKWNLATRQREVSAAEMEAALKQRMNQPQA